MFILPRNAHLSLFEMEHIFVSDDVFSKNTILISNVTHYLVVVLYIILGDELFRKALTH
jgi:hypothetical protein